MKTRKSTELLKENEFGFMGSDEKQLAPFRISGHKRVAIFSDIHVPYHSIMALNAALSFAKKEKPDALLINGDFLDFHKISKYQPDPKKKNVIEELKVFAHTFNIFQKTLKCKIYYKLGNHDIRYQNYLMSEAPELANLPEIQFENIIKARAEGVTIVNDKAVVLLNRLRGIHGHEYRGGPASNSNVGLWLYNKTAVSSFCGHFHRSGSYPVTNLDGKLITTFGVGCLSELHPDFMPFNKWNHGFAIVDLDQNGDDFLFRNYSIYGDKIFNA